MQEPSVPPVGDRAAAESDLATTPRCRRCSKEIAEPDGEGLFRQTGLCFWCAYVDAQG